MQKKRVDIWRILWYNIKKSHKEKVEMRKAPQYKRIIKRRLMFRAALEPTLFLDILFHPSSVSPQK